MAYPAQFHRLVIIGSLYSDIFNTTVSIVPTGGGAMPAVDSSLIEDVATAVAAWWPKSNGAGGIALSTAVVLRSIKLNRIATDGRYADPEAMEYIYPTPIAGPQNINIAPQLTLVATLRGANERALAGRGRMYLPPNILISGPASDGRISAAAATQYGQGVAGLLQLIDGVYIDASIPALVGIASETRTGAFQTLQNITVGRVIDTMRSRRNKLAEDPQVVAY